MIMTPVVSSNISAIGWSQETGLVVQFKSGATYHYAEAPRSLYDGILTSGSPGAYFAKFVRPFYDGDRE